MDRGARQATVHEVAESDMTQSKHMHVRTHTHTHTHDSISRKQSPTPLPATTPQAAHTQVLTSVKVKDLQRTGKNPSVTWR